MAKLLIVDDEADIREFACNFFRRRKITCFTASSGEEALVLAAKHMPDLILLDVMMAGIDGVETLRRLKEWDAACKVIMVTGRNPQELESFDTCQRLGALAYVHKPLELDELERVVLQKIG